MGGWGWTPQEFLADFNHVSQPGWVCTNQYDYHDYDNHDRQKSVSVWGEHTFFFFVLAEGIANKAAVLAE